MLRELGIFERALFISNRHSPLNVIGVVQLENPPMPAILQNALEILQERHTLLQVRIAHSDKRPCFEHIPGVKTPLSNIQRQDDKHWEEIVEQEMAIRFDVSQGPLVRVSYLYEEHRAEIVITFLHSIMDAVSGTNLIDELLGLIALLHSGTQEELSSLEGCLAGRRAVSARFQRLPAYSRLAGIFLFADGRGDQLPLEDARQTGCTVSNPAGKAISFR